MKGDKVQMGLYNPIAMPVQILRSREEYPQKEMGPGRVSTMLINKNPTFSIQTPLFKRTEGSIRQTDLT
jgi:hypothetical protein